MIVDRLLMKYLCLLMSLFVSGAVYAVQKDEPVVLIDDGIGIPCVLSVATDLKDGTVYGGPGTDYRQKGKINKGHAVFVCEKRNGWTGIIYNSQSANRPADDCQLSSYDKGAHVYSGSCSSGWVRNNPFRVLVN